MKNIMQDIETLGTKPGSVILSIGAVAFDETGLGETFYQEITVASCTAATLTVDEATLTWWKRQSAEARATFDRCHLEDHPDVGDLAPVLTAYTAYLKRQGSMREVTLWGNGSDFDNVLVAEAYRAAGVKYPIQFWNHRCFRTLKNLPITHLAPPERKGTHHNALDDAIHQAEHAVMLLQILRSARVNAGLWEESQVPVKNG